MQVLVVAWSDFRLPFLVIPPSEVIPLHSTRACSISFKCRRPAAVLHKAPPKDTQPPSLHQDMDIAFQRTNHADSWGPHKRRTPPAPSRGRSPSSHHPRHKSTWRSVSTSSFTQHNKATLPPGVARDSSPRTPAHCCRHEFLRESYAEPAASLHLTPSTP